MDKFICPSPHKQENLYVKSKHCPCLSLQQLIVLWLDIFERSKLQQERCHGNTAHNKCQALDSGVPHLHWVALCRRILRWPNGHSIRIAHSFLPCSLLARADLFPPFALVTPFTLVTELCSICTFCRKFREEMYCRSQVLFLTSLDLCCKKFGKFEERSLWTTPTVRTGNHVLSQGGTDEDVLEAGGLVKAITSDCLTAIDCRSSS